MFVHKRLDHALRMEGGGNDSSESDNDESVPLKPVPWADDENPFQTSSNPNAVLWEAVYNVHKKEILEGDHDYGLYLTYNFPLPGNLTNDMIRPQLEYIHSQQNVVYKVYCAPGYILEKRDFEEGSELSNIRYFAPYSNNYLSSDDTALLVTNDADLERVIAHFEAIDLEAFADRPSSAYKVVFWSNLKYYIYKLNRPLGVKNSLIPDFVMKNSAICFSAEPSADNLCLFVALAQFFIWVQKGTSFERSKHCRRVQALAKQYLQTFIIYLEKVGLVGEYRQSMQEMLNMGIQREYLPHIENCFKVNINMYQLIDIKTARLEYHSNNSYSNTMYINVTNIGHVNLILDWERYCGNYLCPLCSRFFTRRRNMKSHQLICSKRSKVILEQGFLKHKKHIFLRLLELGIHIPEYLVDRNIHINEFFAVWDCEALLESTETRSVSENLYFMNRHRVICASMASNIPGHIVGKVIINNDSDVLVSLMFEEFDKMQVTMKSIMLQRWGHILNQLEVEIERNEMLKQQFEHFHEKDEKKDEKGQAKIKSFSDPLLLMLKGVYAELRSYLFELPIVSFNGAMYDSNLCRRKLFSYLLGSCK